MNRSRVSIAVSAMAVTFLALTVPGAASAGHLVPPGYSGAGQYTETLPGAGGEEATYDGKQQQGGGAVTTNGSGPSSGTLAEADATKLEALGRDGQKAASLAAASTPVNRQQDGRPGRHTTGDSNGVEQVVRSVTGTSSSDGMRTWLPIILVVIALAMAAYALGRRQAAQRPS